MIDIPDLKIPKAAREYLSKTSSNMANVDKTSAVSASEEITNERLFTVMPRSASSLYKSGNLSYRPASYDDRGQIAYMALLFNENVPDSSRGSVPNVDYRNQLAQLKRSSFQDFFLTNVSVRYSEKAQVVTTFGDTEVAYYFGKEPVVFSLNGVLFDTIHQDWFSKFLTLYGSTLRGTQLARNYELIEIGLPNLRLVGSIMSMTNSQDASNDSIVQFSLEFLVKEAQPLPTPVINGTPIYARLSGDMISFATNSVRSVTKPELINFIANKAGVVSKAFTLGASGVVRELGEKTSAISSQISAFSSSMFSPVYGILSEITKVVNEVTGDISSLLLSFTAPINSVLKDIQSVAAEAISVANLIENSVNKVVSIPERTLREINTTAVVLSNTAGIITRVPETFSQALKRLKNGGRLVTGSPMLSGSSKRKTEKVPLLNSGADYKPSDSYKLPLS